jgi:hypothetical protein
MENFHPQKITAIVEQKVLLTLTYFILSIAATMCNTLNNIFKVLTHMLLYAY